MACRSCRRSHRSNIRAQRKIQEAQQKNAINAAKNAPTVNQYDLLSKQQQPVFSNLLGLLDQSIGQQDFSGIENQYRNEFYNQTIPTIMERLTAMGGENSSALTNQLAGAGADFELGMGGLKSQYLQNQLGMLLNPGFQQNKYTDIRYPQMSWWKQALIGAAPGIAQAGATATGALLL